MVDYKDADGHLIISILKNKDGKCIAATFQPDAFKTFIKAFDGDVTVEAVRFYIEGDGGLMASLANQLQGLPAMSPMRPGNSAYYQQPMYQQLPQTRGVPPADDSDQDDDDDEDDDTDEDTDEDTTT
jgi:hypothetical protein